MTHPGKDEWMDYLYGEITADQKRTLRSHLEECSQCQSDVEGWQYSMKALDGWQLDDKGKTVSRIGLYAGPMLRWTAAAVLMIGLGFVAARLFAPGTPDIEQLRADLETSLKATLEPQIRQNLAGEMNAQWQAVLLESYAGLKDELSRQLHADMNEYALQTLGVCSAATNKLLTELIVAIDTTQQQDRHRIADVFEEIERNRLYDRNVLGKGLTTLAVRTEDQLVRTRNDMAKLLSYMNTDGSYEPETKE